MKLNEDDIELIIQALRYFQKDSIKDRYNHLEELKNKIKRTMSDKEALQEIVYMVNDYVNFADHVSRKCLINDLVKFLEENVIHCSMDNNYK